MLAAKHAYMDMVEARVLLSRVDWPPAPPPGTAATGGILVVCVECDITIIVKQSDPSPARASESNEVGLKLRRRRGFGHDTAQVLD
jgi:hypothetical protein